MALRETFLTLDFDRSPPFEPLSREAGAKIVARAGGLQAVCTAVAQESPPAVQANGSRAHRTVKDPAHFSAEIQLFFHKGGLFTRPHESELS